MFSSFLVLLTTTLACSLLGVFLILRNLSMVADAISHSVLLGIVIAFFITYDLSSPWLIVGAAIFGILSVLGIELLGKSKKVAYNDAIGVVFPMFFALAVILISRFFRNVHLDVDIVLMGEVIFTSLNTISIGGLEIPLAFIRMGGILIINLIFVLAFYNKLQISSFDQQYAILRGIQVTLIYYIFMTLTSLTAVVAFDGVGSILVLSLFIAPPGSAYLISSKLEHMIIYSMLIGIINCTVGTLIAVALNASMTGMCAFVSMVSFIGILLGSKKGLIYRIREHRKTKLQVHQDMLLIHLGNHLFDGRSSIENQVKEIPKHLNWSTEQVDKISNLLIQDKLISLDAGQFNLTKQGLSRYDFLYKQYKLDR